MTAFGFSTVVGTRQSIWSWPLRKQRRTTRALAVYREAILDIVGDIGCRRVIKHNPDRVLAVEMQNDHVVRDVDTLEDCECLTDSCFMA